MVNFITIAIYNSSSRRLLPIKQISHDSYPNIFYRHAKLYNFGWNTILNIHMWSPQNSTTFSSLHPICLRKMASLIVCLPNFMQTFILHQPYISFIYLYPLKCSPNVMNCLDFSYLVIIHQKKTRIMVLTHILTS